MRKAAGAMAETRLLVTEDVRALLTDAGLERLAEAAASGWRCWACDAREITDVLVDLLIATVHRINARADTKVTSEFVAELKRVSGKENILFKMTEAALRSPGERVEDVIYPAVPGGQETLAALLREYSGWDRNTSERGHGVTRRCCLR